MDCFRPLVFLVPIAILIEYMFKYKKYYFEMLCFALFLELILVFIFLMIGTIKTIKITLKNGEKVHIPTPVILGKCNSKLYEELKNKLN